jgi:hypothetical protein
MKRLYLILTMCLFSYSYLFAQVGIGEKCVDCMKNSISNTSSALGIQNTASGEASFASGKLNISLGNFATSLGYSNTAQGMYSLAGGEGSIATGKRSLAWGRYASAESSISLALGSFLRAYGTNAIAMGCFVETTNENAVVIGRGLANDERIINNISGSLMVGFNSNRHTFFVSQAYGLNSTGEIGIGNVTDPSAKLHIVGDSDYLRPNDASLYIESAGNYYSTIYLGDKNHFIKTKPGQDLEFNAAGKDFFFNNGRVGIGTFSPDEKLEVAGNILQPSGWFHATPQIKATDLNGLRLTDKNNIGIFIEDGGNVGIGTNTPDAKLHLYGYPNNSRLRLELNNLEGSYKSWDFNNDNGTLKFQYGSSTTGKPTMEDKMVITGSGNIGIGTSSPSEKLEVAGTIKATTFSGDGSQLTNLTGDNLGNHTATQNINLNGQYLSGNGADNGIFVNAAGNVAIGAPVQQNYTLTVAGKILATELTISLDVPSSDYVFSEEYNLRTLAEVEDYVWKNRHLPEVPSAREFKENGYQVGTMDDLLLRKVEELTLYLIEQQKLLEKQQTLLEKQQAEIEQLKAAQKR